YATTVWNSIKKNRQFARGALAASVLGVMSYLAYRYAFSDEQTTTIGRRLFQLPVLEQGSLKIDAASELYSIGSQDGTNCGYHALKNAHFLVEKLCNNHAVCILTQLTQQDQYLPFLQVWSAQIARQRNSDRITWLELFELQQLAAGIESLAEKTTIVPGIDDAGRICPAEGDASWAYNQRQALAEWQPFIQLRALLHSSENYTHAIILHVNHNHWIPIVVNKRDNKIAFYVTNSLRNEAVSYEQSAPMRFIIDFLTYKCQ
ncbi:MAG: hypothetical protein WD068_03150, partial [Candidatus Babeliales bacterium]